MLRIVVERTLVVNDGGTKRVTVWSTSDPADTTLKELDGRAASVYVRTYNEKGEEVGGQHMKARQAIHLLINNKKKTQKVPS